jgi:hypothetical protein
MAQIASYRIKRTPWKVDVLDRLVRVEQDVKWAISAKGWSLDQHMISPGQRQERTPELSEAEAVVTATFEYIDKTKKCLQPPHKKWQRFREWLAGELLMSVYTNLHAAEANRILLLSSAQLAAILPTIRERADAYLLATDARVVALNGLPDPTAPTHQALAGVQAALVKSVTEAHARTQAQEKLPTPDKAQKEGAKPGAPQPPEQPAPNGQPAPDGKEGIKPPAAGTAGGPPLGGPPPDQDMGLVRLTDMLGRDQQIAATVMYEACRAEDLQQSQVRRFRNVLLGTFAGLFVVVVLVAILGAEHPKYFPLCVRSTQTQSTQANAMICPTGGTLESSADVALIMLAGTVGATLAVARNLAGLKPAGVRYSLSVAQGLIKIVFGAITAVLGIIILSTQTTNLAGILGSQAGLITTAVVFGYSQQLFTKVIDQQASDLENAASSTTKASPASSP